jgi:hypothetical protein
VQRRHRRHRVDDLLAVLGELSDRVEPEVLPAEVRDAGDVADQPVLGGQPVWCGGIGDVAGDPDQGKRQGGDDPVAEAVPQAEADDGGDEGMQKKCVT